MSNFYIDTIKKDKRFLSTSLIKDINLLEPHMRAKIEAIIKDAEAGGHKLVVLETYRSQARQEQLFKQGATQLEKVGTHGYGGAVDMVFLKPDGSPNWSADYSVLRDLAKNHELISGFDWGEPNKHHSFVDKDHIQFCSVADQPKLFSGKWYPPADGSYNPFEHL